jgi:hypothetical protein
MRGLCLGVAAAATLSFGLAAGSAEAGTYTVDFSGTVLYGNGVAYESQAGNDVHGTLVFSNLADTPTSTSDNGSDAFNNFASTVSWTFQVGALPTFTGGGNVGTVMSVSAISDSHLWINTEYDANDRSIYLQLANNDTSAMPGDFHDRLFSLVSAAPTSLAGLIAFLGANLDPQGFFSDGTLGDGVDYQITGFSAAYTTAVTPVPAALPLFASALLGLGGVAWRRRKAAHAAA